ncbi:hypothetical protein CPB83DRAFT_886269 [Crepidotus variabilis]|uniref:Nephrocystin 3-like N-terminal domain-containing protein n=1 Tax=Crepidotus variabilis TaxID=179855 RepID=A0A9P6JKM1_9AGAR|nr:hypothetical protein CPB83DRAFT_886269 [Crepidotus variabilis]
MSMSGYNFLPDARGTEIRDTQFNFVGGNLINQLRGVGGVGFDQLIQHCALNALVDSNERFDAPRCAEETREAIIQEIDEWANNPDLKAAVVLWLCGGAGAGKSALAQTIAEIYKQRGLLVGSFFFSRTASGRNNGDTLLPTLILQLATAFPKTKPIIERILKNDYTVLSRSRSLQMQLLFVNPLCDISTPTTSSSLWFFLQQCLVLILFALQSILNPHIGEIPYGYAAISSVPCLPSQQPILIVIDGLDECADPKVQCDLLHIIAEAIPRFPQTIPLRFLIASRPEVHISRTFAQDTALRSINVQQLDLSADRRADLDIQMFLRRKFSEMKKHHPFGEHLPEYWPTHRDLYTLVQLSSGHFLFASTVLKYIEVPDDFPDQRLDTVLGLLPSPEESGANPFASLDALYRQIFSQVKDRNLDCVLLFFGVLFLNNINLLFNSSARRLNRAVMDDVLGLKRGVLEVILQPLNSLVKLGPYREEPEETPRVKNGEPLKDGFWNFHASLFDFLFDPQRSHQFYLDIRMVHHTIAVYYSQSILPDLFSYSDKEPELHQVGTFAKFLLHCRRSVVPSDQINAISANLTPEKVLYQQILTTECIRHNGGRQVILIVANFLELLSSQAIDSSGKSWRSHLRRIEERILEVSDQSKPLSGKLPVIRENIQITAEPAEIIPSETVLELWRSMGKNGKNPSFDVPMPNYPQLSGIFLPIDSRKEWNWHFEILLWGLSQWTPSSPSAFSSIRVRQDQKKKEQVVKKFYNIFLHLHAMQWHSAITPFSISVALNGESGALELTHIIILLESNAAVAISLLTLLPNGCMVQSHWEQSQWRQFTRPVGFLKDAEQHLLKCADLLLGEKPNFRSIHLRKIDQ